MINRLLKDNAVFKVRFTKSIKNAGEKLKNAAPAAFLGDERQPYKRLNSTLKAT